MFQFQRIWLYEIAIQILKTKTHCFSLTYWTSFTSHVWLHHEILISEKRSAILGGNRGCNTLYWVTLSKSLHLPMCFCLHGVQDSDMCVIKLTRVPRNITVNDKKKPRTVITGSCPQVHWLAVDTCSTPTANSTAWSCTTWTTRKPSLFSVKDPSFAIPFHKLWICYSQSPFLMLPF